MDEPSAPQCADQMTRLCDAGAEHAAADRADEMWIQGGGCDPARWARIFRIIHELGNKKRGAAMLIFLLGLAGKPITYSLLNDLIYDSLKRQQT